MSLKEKLYAPFAEIKSRRGKGGVYDYISWKDVVDRMNDVFGINWSSEIMSQEKVGNDVIVRVRVDVCPDPADFRIRYSQEGYGGATDFEGAEPGNAYKSAYSKALKDACRKWGVGLYLEEEAEVNTTPPAPQNMSTPPSGYSGFETGVPPSTPEVNTAPPAGYSTPEPLPPSYTTPEQPAQVDNSQASAVATGGLPTPPGVAMGESDPKPNHTPPPDAPTTPYPGPPPSAPVEAPPVQNTPSVPPPPPGPPQGGNQELPMTRMGGSKEMISDVQRAALSSILQMQKISYEDLVAEAFQAHGIVKNPLPTVDQLTYDEAVHVVKYGNDKFRKR